MRDSHRLPKEASAARRPGSRSGIESVSSLFILSNISMQFKDVYFILII
jgi:hypothetical protein